MKSLYLTFEDKEFKRIKKIKAKKGVSWETFIIELIGSKDVNVA